MNARSLKGLTMNLLNSGILAGTTTTYTITTTTRCLINGKYATAIAAASNIANVTTDINTGAAFVAMVDNQECVFVIGQPVAGVAMQVAQGSIVDTLAGVTTTPGAAINVYAQFPNLPDNFCPLAYCVVKTAPSSSGFTWGTTAFDTSGIDDTWVDIGVLPDRPQVS